MDCFNIHPQLLQDSHHIGRFPGSHVLLHRNALVPWFILVPETSVTEFLYLPADIQSNIIKQCNIVAVFIKNYFNKEKVNFAALGNVVPQLHLHIIGRSKDDPCWPKPVWGNLHDNQDYDESTLQNISESLNKLILSE